MTDATAQGPRSGFRRVADALDRLALILAGTGLATLVVLIVVQVLFRYLFDQSLAWTEETSRYVFFLTSFIAITVAHRRAKHAAFTLAAGALPVRVRRVVVLGADVLSLVFFVIIGVASIALIEVGLDSFAPATGLPFFVVYLVFPLTAVLGAVFSVERLLDHLAADPGTLLAGTEEQVLRESREATS